MKSKTIFFLFCTALSFLSLHGYTITTSKLDTEKKYESRREEVFYQWTSSEDASVRKSEQYDRGYHPMFVEGRKNREVRIIYHHDEDIFACGTWWFLSESWLIKKHQEMISQGYVLLTISQYEEKQGEPRYMAVWCTPSSEKSSLRFLKRFGITQASISL